MAIDHTSRVIKLKLTRTDAAGSAVNTSKQFNGINLTATENDMHKLCDAVAAITSDTLTSRHYIDSFEMSEDIED